MIQPNKIYTLEFKGQNDFGGDSHFVIVVAASSGIVAKKHVLDTIGFEAEPTWLVGAGYPTIYNQTGTKPLPVQAKILSNLNFHTQLKRKP